MKMGSLSQALVVVLQLLLLLPLSQTCQKKHFKGFLDDGKKGDFEPEVHHHNYHHHYDQNGNEIPPPHPPPHPEAVHPGPYYGSGVEQIEGEAPAKHVVVLQPALPPPEEEENFFDSLIPKKFHPKHILKHHIHKLRDRFRELLGEKKEAIRAKHHYHHGHGKYQKAPVGPPQQSYPYHGGKVAVPALKVPLVQVEAYKPAPPNYPHSHPHPGQPGPGPKAVAYVSPDGYQPAVVVKSKPQYHQPPPPQYTHYVESPAPGPGGPPHSGPHHHHHPQSPQPEYEYQSQPVAYEHPQHPQTISVPVQPQAVAYHPQPQPQPQVTVQVQPQVQHVTYASHEDPYQQHQPQTVPVYRTQTQHTKYSPYGSAPSSYQHFGSSSSSSFSSSPFSSDDPSSGFADSSLYQ